MFVSRLKISSKFISCFGALFLVIVGIGGVGTFGLNRLNANAEQLTGNFLPAIDALGQIGLNVARHRAAQATELLSTDPQARETASQKQTAAVQSLEASWAATSRRLTRTRSMGWPKPQNLRSRNTAATPSRLPVSFAGVIRRARPDCMPGHP